MVTNYQLPITNYQLEVFGLKTVVKRLYEAMFLVDPLGSKTAPSGAGSTAASNGVDSGHSAELSRSPAEADPAAARRSAETSWDSISTATRNILEKAGAEIVSMKKWDERRLAYEINGKNRGAYILCYFHADGQKIRQIERDAQLSELILRVLILGTEGRSKEDTTDDRGQTTEDGR